MEMRSPADTLIKQVSETIPVAGNVAICVDSACTACVAATNFCVTSNTISRVFFGASYACGLLGAASSGAAYFSSATGIPGAGWVGSIGARGFNRLGKYTMRIGSFTSGNVTSVTIPITDLLE